MSSLSEILANYGIKPDVTPIQRSQELVNSLARFNSPEPSALELATMAPHAPFGTTGNSLAEAKSTPESSPGQNAANAVAFLANFLTGKPVRIPNPIKAYHGSPHDFDKFDMSKSRTSLTPSGEIHFHDSPDVAEGFRAMSGWGDKPLAGKRGAVFETNLHAPRDELLNLDAALSDQGPAIQEAVRRIVGSGATLDEAMANASGAGLMKFIQREKAADPAVVLRGEGVHGFQYSDPHNSANAYGIWSPEIIEILRKYGLVGSAGVGASLANVLSDNEQQ
jgi:hypothetical protein